MRTATISPVRQVFDLAPLQTPVAGDVQWFPLDAEADPAAWKIVQEHEGASLLRDNSGVADGTAERACSFL